MVMVGKARGGGVDGGGDEVQFEYEPCVHKTHTKFSLCVNHISLHTQVNINMHHKILFNFYN